MFYNKDLEERAKTEAGKTKCNPAGDVVSFNVERVRLEKMENVPSLQCDGCEITSGRCIKCRKGIFNEIGPPRNNNLSKLNSEVLNNKTMLGDKILKKSITSKKLSLSHQIRRNEEVPVKRKQINSSKNENTTFSLNRLESSRKSQKQFSTIHDEQVEVNRIKTKKLKMSGKYQDSELEDNKGSNSKTLFNSQLKVFVTDGLECSDIDDSHSFKETKSSETVLKNKAENVQVASSTRGHVPNNFDDQNKGDKKECTNVSLSNKECDWNLTTSKDLTNLDAQYDTPKSKDRLLTIFYFRKNVIRKLSYSQASEKDGFCGGESNEKLKSSSTSSQTDYDLHDSQLSPFKSSDDEVFNSAQPLDSLTISECPNLLSSENEETQIKTSIGISSNVRVSCEPVDENSLHFSEDAFHHLFSSPLSEDSFSEDCNNKVLNVTAEDANYRLITAAVDSHLVPGPKGECSTTSGEISGESGRLELLFKNKCHLVLDTLLREPENSIELGSYKLIPHLQIMENQSQILKEQQGNMNLKFLQCQHDLEERAKTEAGKTKCSSAGDVVSFNVEKVRSEKIKNAPSLQCDGCGVTCGRCIKCRKAMLNEIVPPRSNNLSKLNSEVLNNKTIVGDKVIKKSITSKKLSLSHQIRRNEEAAVKREQINSSKNESTTFNLNKLESSWESQKQKRFTANNDKQAEVDRIENKKIKISEKDQASEIEVNHDSYYVKDNIFESILVPLEKYQRDNNLSVDSANVFEESLSHNMTRLLRRPLFGNNIKKVQSTVPLSLQTKILNNQNGDICNKKSVSKTISNHQFKNLVTDRHECSVIDDSHSFRETKSSKSLLKDEAEKLKVTSSVNGHASNSFDDWNKNDEKESTNVNLFNKQCDLNLISSNVRESCDPVDEPYDENSLLFSEDAFHHLFSSPFSEDFFSEDCNNKILNVTAEDAAAFNSHLVPGPKGECSTTSHEISGESGGLELLKNQYQLFLDTLSLETENSIALGRYKVISFLQIIENRTQVLKVQENLKKSEENLKFLQCLHGESQEYVNDVKLVYFNERVYLFVLHATSIEVWKQNDSQDWSKIFSYHAVKKLQIKEICFTKDVSQLVLVMLLTSGERYCLQFLFFDIELQVVRLIENLCWLLKRQAGETVLLCGLPDMKFASGAKGKDGFDVFVHCFNSLKDNPKLVNTCLGSTVGYLQNLLTIEKLPNALLGTSDSMLYIWHISEFRLVASVYLQAVDVLSIDAFIWATIENGRVFLMTICRREENSQVCQLLAVNLATGSCVVAVSYEFPPPEEQAKSIIETNKHMKAAYMDPLLAVAYKKVGFLWFVTDEGCLASLDAELDVTAINVGIDKDETFIVAVGHEKGCVSCYKLIYD